MSYSLKVWCGCTVYVSCHPRTGVVFARVIERRAPECPERRHEIGHRLWLWEMLPDSRTTTAPEFYGEDFEAYPRVD